MSKISVIVPVYNAEKYLSMTLNSILNQTFTDFELICVNDGSEDSSLDILNDFKEKDNRLIVLNQDNQGVSVARNSGIAAAQGEYIVFFDSDDLMHPTFLEKMYQAICFDGADAAYCNTMDIAESCAQIPNIKHSPFKIKTYKNPFELFVQKRISPRIVLWNKIYRADFVKEIPFDVKLTNGEDVLFSFLFLDKCRKISYLNQVLVFYRLSENSLTRRKLKSSRAISEIEAFRRLKNRLEDKNSIYKKFKNSFSKRVFKLAISFVYKKCKDESIFLWEEIYDYVCDLQKNGEFDIKQLSWYRRFLMYLFLHKKFSVLLFFLKTF